MEKEICWFCGEEIENENEKFWWGDPEVAWHKKCAESVGAEVEYEEEE